MVAAACSTGTTFGGTQPGEQRLIQPLGHSRRAGRSLPEPGDDLFDVEGHSVAAAGDRRSLRRRQAGIQGLDQRVGLFAGQRFEVNRLDRPAAGQPVARPPGGQHQNVFPVHREQSAEHLAVDGSNQCTSSATTNPAASPTRAIRYCRTASLISSYNLRPAAVTGS